MAVNPNRSSGEIVEYKPLNGSSESDKPSQHFKNYEVDDSECEQKNASHQLVLMNFLFESGANPKGLKASVLSDAQAQLDKLCNTLTFAEATDIIEGINSKMIVRTRLKKPRTVGEFKLNEKKTFSPSTSYQLAFTSKEDTTRYQVFFNFASPTAASKSLLPSSPIEYEAIAAFREYLKEMGVTEQRGDDKAARLMVNLRQINESKSYDELERNVQALNEFFREIPCNATCSSHHKKTSSMRSTFEVTICDSFSSVFSITPLVTITTPEKFAHLSVESHKNAQTKHELAQIQQDQQSKKQDALFNQLAPKLQDSNTFPFLSTVLTYDTRTKEYNLISQPTAAQKALILVLRLDTLVMSLNIKNIPEINYVKEDSIVETKINGDKNIYGTHSFRQDEDFQYLFSISTAKNATILLPQAKSDLVLICKLLEINDT